MWDRAAACFHADKKPPDSCGRGSSGCGRTVLNFKPVRALPAWNASRIDGASTLRMESEPQKRSSSRSVGRPTPRPVRMESGRTGLGVGRPTEREDDRFCGSLSILKVDAPSILEAFQAGKARTGLKFNTVRPQPLEPRPQESGGFLSAWKQAAARSHIGFYSQRVRPLLQVRRAEFCQQITPAFLFCAISIGKILERFTMGQ